MRSVDECARTDHGRLRSARWPLLALVSAAAAWGGCQSHTGGLGDRVAPLVRVEAGLLRGERLPTGIAAFRGVPYALPPIAERRWRPPSAPAAWQGIRNARVFAPACPQGDSTADYYRRAARRLGRNAAEVPALGPTSEDCLYLNVWTPARDSGERLPIFVWIHGGAGTSGTGADPLFRGDRLADRGLVVVTVNYRLGALGFLAHPVLSAGDPGGVSGNYALHDVLRALEWLASNARAFGGDPDRITLAGQSAGASLIEVLMTSPASEGLFHRVISHSATWVEPPPLNAADGTADTGEDRGVRFLQALGVEDGRDEARLRALPVDSLINIRAAEASVPSTPVIDGHLLPDEVSRRWSRGELARVPLLKGRTSDEFALFMPPEPLEPSDYQAWLEAEYDADMAGAVLAAYPPGADAESTRRQRVRFLSDRTFGVPLASVVRWAARDDQMIWLYRFAWRPDDGAVGAFHGVDLPFVFGTHREAGWWETTTEVDDLTELVQRLWARFASAGHPNGSGLPQWPAASPDLPITLVLDVPPHVEPLRHADLLVRLAGPNARGRAADR